MNRQLALRAVSVLGFALPVVFYSRSLASFGSFTDAFAALLALSPPAMEEMTGAAWRTVFVSIVSAFGAGSLGLVAGQCAIGSGRGLSRPRLLLLLIPFFLGEAVTGFIIRWALDNPWVGIHTTEWPPFIALSLIAANQMLRFGALFAFVMASQCALVDHVRIEFAVAHQLERGRFLRDSVLPDLIATFQLCCCLAFAASMLENTLAMTVFRASPGNQLELLSHWTTRQYQGILKSDPQLARDFAILLASLEFAATLLLGWLVFVLARPIARVLSKCLLEWPGAILRPSWRELLALRLLQGYAGLLLGALAVLITARRADFEPEIVLTLIPFLSTVAWGLAAGVISAGLACIFAVLCSLAWPTPFAGLGRTSTLVLAVSVLLSGIPTVYVLLTVYDWVLAVLKTQYGLESWLCGHIVSILPLLFSFFLITHFAVRTIEMDFQAVHQVRLDFLVYRSFVQRFFPTYLLGAFCAFALIWNDYTINSALNTAVPSFASALDMALEGRSANKSMAVACSVLSLAIGSLCALGLSSRAPFMGKRAA